MTGEGRQTTPSLSIYIVLRCLVSLIRQEKTRKILWPKALLTTMMERSNINMTWWWDGRMSVCFCVCWLMNCSLLLVFVYSKSWCIILPLNDLVDASFKKILLKNCFLTEDIYYLFDWLVNMTKEDAAWWQDIPHSFTHRNSLIIHSF